MTEYTFPNISFNSKIIGNAQAKPQWKDGYAIIGEFNRGPVVPIASSSREVLASLFGEDASSGSIALQQAMQQGASNAVVARVVPSTEAGNLTFQVAGENIYINPTTAFESGVGSTLVLDDYNRTTGFNLTLDYIGSPVSNKSSYGSVQTAENAVTHPTFKGRAQIDFVVTKTQPGVNSQPVVYEDTNETLNLSLHNTDRSGYQIVTYTEGNNEYVEQYLKQGFTLRAKNTSQAEGLVIASEPYDYDTANGVKGILVKGHFSPATSYGAEITTASGLNTINTQNYRKGANLITASGTYIAGSVALFNGVSYPVSSVTASGGYGLAVTFASNISSAVTAGSPIVFLPKVFSTSYASSVTTVVLTGVLSNTDIVVGSRVSFGSRFNSYEVVSVSTAWSAGSITVTFAGDIRAAVKLRDYALVTIPVTSVLTGEFRVHFPTKTQYVTGYSFKSFDNGALAATTVGHSYFSGAGSVYSTGLNSYDLDSYVVLEEGTGNQFLDFKFQTAATNSTVAQVLGQEFFGLSQKFGFDNDIKLYLSKNASWSVPFLKTDVTVGGEFGSNDEYAPNTCADTILKDLEFAIYADSAFSSMVKDVKVDISEYPYTFTVAPSFAGLESNRCKWNLIRYIAGPSAVYESHSAGVITVDTIPDVLSTAYFLVLEGVRYDVTSLSMGTVTVDQGANADFTFLDALSLGDTLRFECQAETLDILVRQDLTANFGVTDYGADNYFTFKGGRDSATFAYRDFYNLSGEPLVRVRALNPGSYGNNLRLTILPDQTTADSARFYLQVEDLNPDVVIGGSKTETFYLDNKTIDKTSGLYTDTRESNLIRAYFIPAVEPSNVANLYNLVSPTTFRSLPIRVAPPLEVQDSAYASGYTKQTAQGARAVKAIKLQGGQEYLDTSVDAAIRARKDGYLAALKQIEAQNVALIVIAGIFYGDNDYKEVFDEVKAVVERSTPMTGGFCRAVIELAPQVSPRQASVLRQQMDSDRVVQIAGSIRGTLNNGVVYSGTGAAGAYAGLYLSRPPHISPASVYGNRSPVGISYSNIDATPANLEAYTQAGTEVVYFDSGLGVYKFLNGITTSTDRNKRYFSVLQTWDQLRNDVYLNLLQYRSEPGNEQLRGRIATAVDAYLADKLRLGWLLRYSPTICDARNNTSSDLMRGIVNLTMQATPVFPADFLRVTDVLDLSDTSSVAVQPAQTIANF